MDRPDHIGVPFEIAFNTRGPRSAEAFFLGDMPAARTRPAGVLRRYGNELSSIPCQFVVQLPTELIPTLIEDGLIQDGFGPDVFARCFGRARGRLGLGMGFR